MLFAILLSVLMTPRIVEGLKQTLFFFLIFIFYFVTFFKKFEKAKNIIWHFAHLFVPLQHQLKTH